MTPPVKKKTRTSREPGTSAAPPLAHPTRQARSRKMVERLLAAARDVLAHEGLAAATVPRIARKAGVSVGAVYRRFPDKDALMRAVHDQVTRVAGELNRAMLDPERWEGVPPEDIARSVVHGMTVSYLRSRGLLRALLLYARTHPDPRFRRRAEAHTAATLDRIADLLLPHRARLRHPDPRRSIEFGLVSMAIVLQGLILSETIGANRWMPPEDELGDELTRMFLGYLGLPQNEVRAPWVAPPRGRPRTSLAVFRKSQVQRAREMFAGEPARPEAAERRAPRPARAARSRVAPLARARKPARRPAGSRGRK